VARAPRKVRHVRRSSIAESLRLSFSAIAVPSGLRPMLLAESSHGDSVSFAEALDLPGTLHADRLF